MSASMATSSSPWRRDNHPHATSHVVMVAVYTDCSEQSEAICFTLGPIRDFPWRCMVVVAVAVDVEAKGALPDHSGEHVGFDILGVESWQMLRDVGSQS